jgi:hypothetical protein
VIDVFVDALDLAEMSFEGGGAGGRYLSQLDTADRQEPTEALADTLGSWLPGPMFLRDRFYTTKTHSRTRGRVACSLGRLTSASSQRVNRRQGELKAGAARQVRARPQSSVMRLDN